MEAEVFWSAGVGLAYDSVMSLIDPSFLGCSETCTARTSARVAHTERTENLTLPCTDANALTKKDPRGSIRWIRNDPLVFVKWMDTREVAMCYTSIHEAHSGSTVRRMIKTPKGGWDTKSITCPTPVMEYNKHMGRW